MAENCKKIKESGERCRAWPVTGSDYCWAHDPKLAKKRSKAKSKGGRARAYKKGEIPGPVETVDDVLAGVNAALEGAWSMDLTPEVGRLLATLYGLTLQVIDKGLLEERVSALEQRIEDMQTSGN